MRVNWNIIGSGKEERGCKSDKQASNKCAKCKEATAYLKEAIFQTHFIDLLNYLHCYNEDTLTFICILSNQLCR